ncbi:hypothetical protein KEM48_001676 [Puccinia striiformis f. sp. tritici PST-130]|nr:hypothetical protein KEM48_001676 [Puccinia striiformis f. sp. tritici PST-130]
MKPEASSQRQGSFKSKELRTQHLEPGLEHHHAEIAVESSEGRLPSFSAEHVVSRGKKSQAWKYFLTISHPPRTMLVRKTRLPSSVIKTLRTDYAYRHISRSLGGQQIRSIASNAKPILEQLDLIPSRTTAQEPLVLPGVYDGQWKQGKGEILRPIDPATGQPIGLQVSCADETQTLEAITNARKAFKTWRNVPGPKRGEILKDFNTELVRLKDPLAGLITLEMGNPKPAWIGRSDHCLQLPLCCVRLELCTFLITGNATIWKPSPTTPLTAIAMNKIITRVLESHGVPGALSSLVCGGSSVGGKLATEKGVDLLSFTGSEHVGKLVGETVQARFGKVLLELGGNNALVVMPSASIDLALRATVFGAVGTAGQRCTTTRRLFLHESISDEFLKKLKNPMSNQFVEPTIIDWGDRLKDTSSIPEIVRKEVFAPILHVGRFSKLEEAVEMTNSVDQALSSSLFSTDIGDVFYWTGPNGSRCGIVNVNAGTSGAEIGAGFGGNFHTGWGRESGGDAWKQYCRWSSCTINFSDQMPLAQGINFS